MMTGLYNFLNRKLRRKLNESFGKPPKQSEYSLNSIEMYRLYQEENPRVIDDITWDDLDMDKVFRRINVCHTSVGEEYLYNCLHEPQFDESKLLKREEFIIFLKDNPEERLKLQVYLAKLGKINYNGIPAMIYSSDLKLLGIPVIYKILSVIPFLCLLAVIFNAFIGVISFIISFMVNFVIYIVTKRKMETSLPTIRYFSSLIWCCGKLVKNFKAEPFIQQSQPLFQTFKSSMKKGANILQQVNSIEGIFYEYWRILRLSDIRNYNKIFSGFSIHKEQFHELYKTLGEIDISICVLSFRESLINNFCSTPVFHDEKHIKFEEIYHPLLSDPVPNSGLIQKNSIITGSNASGKSTFVKALAINGILAQTIFTCTAKEFATQFSLVLTSMAVRDNITEGESYFITEIKSLKRILDKMRIVRCVCYIDEILRGTNTVERIAASSSILNYLNDKDCLCVVASHDIELAQMHMDKLDNYHFREMITGDGMVFDYKINDGISNTRNAIKLLRYMDFENSIVENAENLAGKINN